MNSRVFFPHMLYAPYRPNDTGGEFCVRGGKLTFHSQRGS